MTMKSVLFFFGGALFGVFFTLLGLNLISDKETTLDGVTYFEEEGKCISDKSFKVIQVLESGDALANEVEKWYKTYSSTGLTVLLDSEDGDSYYDDQIINVPSEKCARQIGIFRYSAKSGMEKTVPIVRISDK